MRVARSDWWASRKVVSVIRRRFCFATHVAAEFLRPHLREELFGARGRIGSVVVVRHRGRGELAHGLDGVALGEGIAVHDHVRDVVQHLRRAVLALLELEQMRIGIDEARGGLTARKTGSAITFSQERNVRLYAPDAEFPQRAVHAVQRQLVVPAKTVTFTSMES